MFFGRGELDYFYGWILWGIWSFDFVEKKVGVVRLCCFFKMVFLLILMVSNLVLGFGRNLEEVCLDRWMRVFIFGCGI